MNVQPEVPKPAPASPQRRPLKLALAGIVVAGLVLLVIVLFLRITHAEPKLTWLTTAEWSRATRTGTFTRLKYKLMNLTAPLWQRWMNRMTINIQSTLLTLSDEAAQQLLLPPPAATNADGLRAWILSPAELSAFKQLLKTNSGASIGSQARITTRDGSQAQVSVGDRLTAGTNSAFAGLTVDLVPKVAAGSIRLMVGVLSTGAADPASDPRTVVQTNFAAACRGWLPSAGGLLMEGGRAEKAAGTRQWFLIAPTAMDGRGNAISLQR
jgi:hypothetical protein